MAGDPKMNREEQNRAPESAISLDNKNLSEEKRARINYILRRAGLSGVVNLK